jgi:glutaminyl-tRNA synthetase
VLDPLRLIIDNYPAGQSEDCFAPNHPLKPETGKRAMPFGRELWIEREDFMEHPSKGYHRLYPGNMARLRYGYVVRCTAASVTRVAPSAPCTASTCPTRRVVRRRRRLQGQGQSALGFSCRRLSGRGAALRSSVHRSVSRRRREGDPEGVERDFRDDLNPDSIRVIQAWLEPALKTARAEERFQFERHGYFVADRVDSRKARRYSTGR